MLRSLILALLLVWSTEAATQSQPSLQVLIEELHDAAKKCGITEDIIRAPVVLTLRNNRINPSGSHMNPYFYLNVIVLHDQNLNRCTYGVDVSIRGFQMPSNRNGFIAQKSENAILCWRSTVGYAPQAAIVKSLTDSIEQLTKQCLATVDY